MHRKILTLILVILTLSTTIAASCNFDTKCQFPENCECPDCVGQHASCPENSYCSNLGQMVCVRTNDAFDERVLVYFDHDTLKQGDIQSIKLLNGVKRKLVNKTILVKDPTGRETPYVTNEDGRVNIQADDVGQYKIEVENMLFTFAVMTPYDYLSMGFKDVNYFLNFLDSFGANVNLFLLIFLAIIVYYVAFMEAETILGISRKMAVQKEHEFVEMVFAGVAILIPIFVGFVMRMSLGSLIAILEIVVITVIGKIMLMAKPKEEHHHKKHSTAKKKTTKKKKK